MLHSAEEIQGYQVMSTDGPLGAAVDFLIDDRDWKIRYLVVDTEKWLQRRHALLYTGVLDPPNHGARVVPVPFPKQTVKESPVFATEKPLSRREEAKLFCYFNWVPYWGSVLDATAPAMPVEGADQGLSELCDRGNDSHLHKLSELRLFHVFAGYTAIGDLCDVVVDDEKWIVCHLVVSLNDHSERKKVILAKDVVERVQPETRTIDIRPTAMQLKHYTAFESTPPGIAACSKDVSTHVHAENRETDWQREK